jgi:hypothetical protein
MSEERNMISDHYYVNANQSTYLPFWNVTLAMGATQFGYCGLVSLD